MEKADRSNACTFIQHEAIMQQKRIESKQYNRNMLKQEGGLLLLLLLLFLLLLYGICVLCQVGTSYWSQVSLISRWRQETALCWRRAFTSTVTRPTRSASGWYLIAFSRSWCQRWGRCWWTRRNLGACEPLFSSIQVQHCVWSVLYAITCPSKHCVQIVINSK